jgi:hypothetical protein
MSKKEEYGVFSGMGAPLGALSAKIIIGHALGLYGPLTYKDLHIIRSVRNSFAHTALPIDFGHEEINKKCLKLTSPERLSLDPVYSGFGKPFDLTKARERFIYASRSISTELLLHARHRRPSYQTTPKIQPIPPEKLP